MPTLECILTHYSQSLHASLTWINLILVSDSSPIVAPEKVQTTLHILLNSEYLFPRTWFSAQVNGSWTYIRFTHGKTQASEPSTGKLLDQPFTTLSLHPYSYANFPCKPCSQRRFCCPLSQRSTYYCRPSCKFHVVFTIIIILLTLWWKDTASEIDIAAHTYNLRRGEEPQVGFKFVPSYVWHLTHLILIMLYSPMVADKWVVCAMPDPHHIVNSWISSTELCHQPWCNILWWKVSACDWQCFPQRIMWTCMCVFCLWSFEPIYNTSRYLFKHCPVLLNIESPIIDALPRQRWLGRSCNIHECRSYNEGYSDIAVITFQVANCTLERLFTNMLGCFNSYWTTLLPTARHGRNRKYSCRALVL